MSLWVDKHRPHTLDKLDLHLELKTRLTKMVRSGDFPHVLFYGPSGSGKKTRIMAVLRELFGPAVERVKVVHKSFKVRSKVVELSALTSNYHIELNPSDVGISDRLVVQEVIKEIAQTHSVVAAPLGSGGSSSSTGTAATSAAFRAFKVVILTEVDRLSREAQQALRRTMEKYMATCRLILCCESTCRVIAPLRSRCLPVRVPAPSHEDIAKVLQNVARKENLVLPPALAARIAASSGRNLRKAILMMEASKVERYPFVPDQQIRVADWERFIEELSQLIVEDQSPARLQLCRDKLYELLTNCIPPEVVMRNLTQQLMRRVDDQLRHQLIRWAAHYEHRMQCGSKPIFHMEAFIAKFMSLYKRWSIEFLG